MDRRDLERLGHHVVSRRVALGYRTRTDLAASLQFTVRTLADIEHGVRKASAGTYAMLENKLAWAPGSIDTILAGGEPKEPVVELRRDDPKPPSHTSTDALSLPPPRNCCWSYAAASSPPATRRGDTRDDSDGGLNPHGDWPEQGYHVAHVSPSVSPLARCTRSRDQPSGHMPDARYLASWYFSQPG